MANVPARPTAEGSRILQMWNIERQRTHQARTSVPRPRLVRSFAAAEVSRLTASFQADHASVNQDLEYSLRLMVGRSRQLAKNNDYVKKFLRMCQNHIVGPDGFRLHVPCKRPDGSLDTADSLIVESAFERWGRMGVCDVTSKLSFRLLCRLMILHCARDGEVFVRRVRNRRNKFGYQLQIIDPMLVDHSYRADLGNGVRVRMGVETDADGRPLAYHLLNDVEIGIARQRTRVPAEEMWHLFLVEDASQLRGVPWLHTAMRRLNDMGAYEQAAIIAARVGASKMAFFTQRVDSTGGPVDPGQLGDLENPDDPNSAIVTEAEPGTFELLPEGVEDVKTFDPAYPHENYDVFIKACLRGIASGVGVDYNTLANDLEGVNYSSMRHGALETRDGWMGLQRWFSEGFLDPGRLYTEWLEMAFVSGQLNGLPVSKFDKYDVAKWQGRRWPWVDPKNDTESKLMEIDNGLASYSGYIREKGGDPEAVWRELEEDQARIKHLLRKPNPPPAPAALAAGATSSE